MKTKSYINGIIVLFVLFVLLVLCVIFISIANRLDLWQAKDSIKQIVGVMFSSLLLLIGTVIVMGLQVQANYVEKRRKTMFDEKIIVFRDFLCDLYNIIKNKQICESEEYELQIKLSYLSLHIKEPENMMKISRAISDIITKIKNMHNKDKGIMIELMEITDVMYKELYGEEVTTHSKKQTLEDLRDEMVLEFYSINVPPEDITAYHYVVKRIREIKKMISLQKESKVVIYDRQWVYNGYTLVHDLYTDWDKNSKQFVCNERSNKYAVDLRFDTKGKFVTVELFSRKNSREETDKLLKQLQDKSLKPAYFKNYHKDSVNSIQENGHYMYAQLDTKNLGNEYLAKEIVELLNAIDKCREKN